MVMMPLLVTLSMFTGLLGGYGISAITNVLPVSEYLLGIQYAFIPFYVWYSFIKTIIFAFIIASMASYYGYYAKGGALEVGKASTKAVVNSSIVVLLMDVVLTNLMLN
jgi:phospholipid/cholesterol/gamma-HCH transport system permease protein